jgi:hypothetical protein
MSEMLVIRGCCDSRGTGRNFRNIFLGETGGRPLSRRAQRCRFVLCSLLAAAAIIFILPARADTPVADSSPEGFSASSEGLPEAVIDAWYATVIIESRRIDWLPGRQPRWRGKTGSGTVVKIDHGRSVAVIATNAHVITCGDQACGLRVGFSHSEASRIPKWTKLVRVVSRDTAKDLAFIEAEIPHGAEVRAPKFAATECGEVLTERVLSIGWPDLSVRRKWGVEPPPNSHDRVKRYSDGIFLLSLKRRRNESGVGRSLDRMQVLFHNSDVLPGSSGGPVVNWDGEIFGMNTMILRGVSTSDSHRFCARLDLRKSGDCVHVAIASRELIDEFERLYASRIALAGCSSSPEFEGNDKPKQLREPSFEIRRRGTKSAPDRSLPQEI